VYLGSDAKKKAEIETMLSLLEAKVLQAAPRRGQRPEHHPRSHRGIGRGYPGAFLCGHPKFIAVWLALKTAGQWRRWSIGDDGQSRYQIFLIGNALSLMFGLIAYGLIRAYALDP